MLKARFLKNTSWSVYNCITRSLQIKFYTKYLPVIVLNYVKSSNYKIRNVNHTLVKNLSYNKNHSDFDHIQIGVYNNCDEYIINKFSEKDLYPTTNDATILTMKPLVAPEEILNHFENFKDKYNAKTFIQATQKLWLYQQKNSKQGINLSGNLNIFLHHMTRYIVDMNFDEASHCLLYLTRLGISCENIVMKNLYFTCCNLLKVEKNISLSALSRYSYICNLKKEFSQNKSNVSTNFFSELLKHIQSCNDFDSMYLITTCLHNFLLFVNDETLLCFMNKLSILLCTGDNKNIPIKHLLKITSFLTYPKWSSTTSKLNRQILLLLSSQVETMDQWETEITLKIFQTILEPANILPKLLDTAKIKYKNNSSLELLAFVANFDHLERRKMMQVAENILLRDLPKEKDVQKILPSLYKLLRTLKISNLKLCNLYWESVLREIDINENERELNRIIKHCFRYMFFNNNLGGTFRHLKFEKVLTNIALEAINDNLPHDKFARLASFIIAYGIKDRNGYSFIPEAVINIMEKSSDNFNSFDCLQLSKGIQIASELRYKNKISKRDFPIIKRIETVVQTSVKRILENENINTAILNLLIRTLNNVEVQTTSELYVKTVEFYNKSPISLDSRSIRDVAFNLLSSNYLVPGIITHCFNYINENKTYVLGDTVAKVLHTAYTLAYIPVNEESLYWSAEIVKRDFDYMTTTSIVQACLSLSFYKIIPCELVQKVFAPEFVKRIEDDIELCYSKQTYPNRILNQVMQLNRSVCLDFPEIQIPWFQQNYIEAQMSKTAIYQTKISAEIANVLSSIVTNKESIISNQSTPYGYKIDFVVNINFNKTLVNNNCNKLDSLRRFAILLLKRNAYCKNDSENIKGFEIMRIRHLEMLGFNVIHINLSDWNALHMNVPGAKTLFLKSLLKLT